MQKGNRVITDTEIAIVSGGTAAIWTNVSLSTLIPPTATEVQLSGAVSAGVNGAGQIWARPKNWGNGFRVNDARLSNEVNWGGSLEIPILDQSVDYKMAGIAGTPSVFLFLQGWTEGI
jgi:hypothetical protein